MTVEEALELARRHGVNVMLDGDSLHLEADAPPPNGLLAILGRGKWDIVAALRLREAEELRRGLAPFEVDVRLTDLYPDVYPAAEGYVTSQPLDASEPGQLRHALELAGPACTAIITNTPHNTDEACAIVENLIALVEEQRVEFVAALFRSIWGAEPGRLPYLTGRPSVAKSFAVGVLGGSLGAKEARCMPTHGTSGGTRPGAARP
jgi:hypothetical protein